MRKIFILVTKVANQLNGIVDHFCNNCREAFHLFDRTAHIAMRSPFASGTTNMLCRCNRVAADTESEVGTLIKKLPDTAKYPD
jgi:hypothetical protein